MGAAKLRDIKILNQKEHYLFKENNYLIVIIKLQGITP